MAGSPVLGVLGAVALLGSSAAPAAAAPPPNDAPEHAAQFEPYTAQNGNPGEQQAGADLVEATADPGVPRCLGPTSFDRTVWFRVPEAPEPREVHVEAAGRTLQAVDMAVFVQPDVRAGAGMQVREPNACAGAGAGAADAAEDAASAVTLHVPPFRPLLVQVGRRGTRRSAQDEAALLSLRSKQLLDFGAPAGDRAGSATPGLSSRRPTRADLAGATITEEDPAQPACPSLGTVWRKFTPGRSGRRLISVSGRGVETLTVFAGSRPTGDNVLDCVNRAGGGALEMVVSARKRRPVWVRIGTDHPPDDAEAVIRLEDGRGRTVIDGGPGGFDPTPGGPAGGFPSDCFKARVKRARITGSVAGAARSYNRFTRVPLRVRARGASVCDAELRLMGPKGRLYAKGRALRLKGRQLVRLPRQRTFRPGRYRLKVRAVDRHGRTVRVKTRVRGWLR